MQGNKQFFLFCKIVLVLPWGTHRPTPTLQKKNKQAIRKRDNNLEPLSEHQTRSGR